MAKKDSKPKGNQTSPDEAKGWFSDEEIAAFIERAKPKAQPYPRQEEAPSEDAPIEEILTYLAEQARKRREPARVGIALNAWRRITDFIAERAAWATKILVTDAISEGRTDRQRLISLLRRTAYRFPGLDQDSKGRVLYLPAGLYKSLVEALEKLELGEVDPLFQKGRKRHHGHAYFLRRLRACEVVEFLYGWGLSYEEAMFQVAKDCGQSASTIDAWRDEFRQAAEPVFLTRIRLSAAREAGWLQADEDQFGPGDYAYSSAAYDVRDLLLEEEAILKRRAEFRKRHERAHRK